MPDLDLIIIGAGAAGLMCAIESNKRGRRVLVLERAEKPGKKSGSPAVAAPISPTYTSRR
jgi:predicted flavoprotein YhiN